MRKYRTFSIAKKNVEVLPLPLPTDHQVNEPVNHRVKLPITWLYPQDLVRILELLF